MEPVRRLEANREKGLDRFKRYTQAYPMLAPTRRPLKIYTLDPSARGTGFKVGISVPNEELEPGPIGDRIRVVDYDGPNDCLYAPVDLNQDGILMQGGLDPSESDPRFHQQMVYAVTMRVLESFEQALGRTLTFKDASKGDVRLTVVPHAFDGANAFFDPEDVALLFGYFKADMTNPGPNLPGQTVFTCLSHDVVAHEMSHAIVHRLRPHFSQAMHPDTLAFHEGFADIVAIFEHFTFPDVLRDQIQQHHGDLRQPGTLLELAGQFGYATGQGSALRSVFEGRGPDPNDYQTLLEPHDRGSLLVAAVFDAFFAAYQARITDIVKLATFGTGQLPEGYLHPDLVRLLADKASRAAASVLQMCIRALEYTPPVGITFGDYLRALVTADVDLYPEDQIGQRASLIEAFRVRGIYPVGVTSLAEESIVLEPGAAAGLEIPDTLVRGVTTDALFAQRLRRASGYDAQSPQEAARPQQLRDNAETYAIGLHGWAEAHRTELGFEDALPIEAHDFHPLFRVTENGNVRVDLVAEFVQTKKLDEEWRSRLGCEAIRGGTTVICDENGSVRYLVVRPVPTTQEALSQFENLVSELDFRDTTTVWLSPADFRRRTITRSSFAALHRVIRTPGQAPLPPADKNGGIER